MSERSADAYRTRMIREMPQDERPRERMVSHGPTHLSNSELLAILLNTGITGESVMVLADRMLRECGGLPGIMRRDVSDLASMRGLGAAKATRVLAGMELGRRLAAISPEDRPRIGTPEDVISIVGVEMMALEQEQLRVVLLDAKHHILTTRTVVQGSTNTAHVRVAEIFRAAVRENAVALVLVHNHPSGDPSPSSADIELTTQCIYAGRMLDIDVVDHIVIGVGRHASLKRLGVGGFADGRNHG